MSLNKLTFDQINHFFGNRPSRSKTELHEIYVEFLIPRNLIYWNVGKAKVLEFQANHILSLVPHLA
jgi:hypothetical protein